MANIGMRMLVALAVLIGACGDGGNTGNPGTGPVDESVAQQLCMDGCQREIQCDKAADVEACTESCVAAAVGIYREDAMTEFFECAVDLACDEPSHVCHQQIEKLPAHEAYESACFIRYEECGLASEQIEAMCSLDGTLSGYLKMFVEVIVEDLATCFEVACDAIDACRAEVAATYGIGP